jgi:uncharacterized protein (UPF0276 family)
VRRPHLPQVFSNEDPRADGFEVISDKLLREGGIQGRHIKAVRQRYRIVPHGVSMSFGGNGPV